MEMKEFLSKDLINLEMKANTKRGAIIELCELLFENGYITNVDDFVDDIYQREEEGETGIGQGVAIPHGKSDNVIKTSLAIGRPKEIIGWEGEENQPVEIIILFAVRMVDNTSVHLQLLSQVATKLGNDYILDRLKSVEDPQEIINIFIG